MNLCMFKNILRMSTGGSGTADLRYHVAEKRVAEEADTPVAGIRHSALATAAARPRQRAAGGQHGGREELGWLQSAGTRPLFQIYAYKTGRGHGTALSLSGVR